MLKNPKVIIPQGDKVMLVVTVKNEDGTAVDLTGGKARWWMGPSATARGTEVLLKKDTVGGGCTMALIGGFWVIAIPILSVDTKALPPKIYYHEVEIEDASGNISTVYEGKLIILPTLIASQV